MQHSTIPSVSSSAFLSVTKSSLSVSSSLLISRKLLSTQSIQINAKKFPTYKYARRARQLDSARKIRQTVVKKMETGNPSGYKNLDDQQIQGKQPSKASKEPMKVKYISSPVMVNAKNAAEFKAIVQELTGKDSSDDGHHHRSSGDAAGSRATINEFSQGQGSFNYGGTNAKFGYGVDQVQGSSTMGSHEFEEDIFWKFSGSLPKYEFPYG